MPKKFLSNVLLLLAVNLLIKPFWILGIDRTVQNTVGNEAYGAYINLFTLSLLFSMLLDFGINNYTSTFIARHKHMLDKKFAALLPLKLLFSGAYLIATLGFGLLYGYKGFGLLLLFCLGINQVMAFFILFFRANISGLQLFRTDSFLSVTDRGMMIIFALLLFFVLKGNFRVEHFIMAQSAGYLASLCISFFVLKKHLNFTSLTFNKVMMFSIIRQAWPYALLALLMTVYTRTDYLLIKKILPDGDLQNGIYAVANRLFEAANMMAVLVATMLLPLFANMIKKGEDLTALIKICMVLLLIPAVTIAALSWNYAFEIIGMLSKNNPLASAQVFPFVMLSFVAMCVMYIFGTLLTAGANLKILNYLAAIAIAINLVLNLVLIPKMGAKGAAITAVCTHGFIALSNAFFAVKRHAIRLNTTFVAAFSFILLSVVALVTVCRLWAVPLPVSAGLSVVYVIVLLFATRLINIRQLTQLGKHTA
ncbi:MAG: oligosaccharide flippase family protein [Bacteroidota bacterium]